VTLFRRKAQDFFAIETSLSILWGIGAICLGLLVATLSFNGVVAIFSLIAFCILIAISSQNALALLLIFAPMRALIETEVTFRLPLDIGQLLVLIFIGRWLVDHIMHRKPIFSLRWSEVVIPIFAFLFLTGVSIFSAASIGSWIREWLKWLIIIVLAIITLNLANKRNWERIIALLITAGLANALVGIYVFTGGSGADHLRISDRFFRALGTFGQPNPFGGFMGLLAPIALMMTLGYGLFAFDRLKHQRLVTHHIFPIFFYGLSAFLLSIGVLISWSRGAWLSYGLALFVIIIALPRKWWQSIALCIIACIIGLMIWFCGALPLSIEQRIRSVTEDIVSVSDARGVDITTENFAIAERLAHWQAATNMISTNLWIGVGFGNYEIAYDSHRLINWDEPLGHAHNYYLNVFAETGIIGLVGYGVMWIALFWFTWCARQHPDIIARSFAIGLLGTWTYLAVHSMTDNLYVNNIFLHIGVMIGLLGIIHRQTWQTNRYHTR